MTGAELRDRDRGAGPGYRDPLGLVSQGRTMSRPRMALAVAAVCGAGLLAGLGLFGGSAAAPRPAVPAVGIVKAADTVGARPEAAHRPPARRPHARHPAQHPAQHPARHSAQHPAPHPAKPLPRTARHPHPAPAPTPSSSTLSSSHGTPSPPHPSHRTPGVNNNRTLGVNNKRTKADGKGSAGTGAPHGAVRHSPVPAGGSDPVRPSAPGPATARPAAPAATPRTAPPPSSPATGPAASR
ncbi:hypothetical protein GCM10009839_05150 [Catenulispora yoronensis]|uniref:Translation initiation factor IF-2 n=1 Tax=Catenulispora yoronensis TaxID=450799 RepID=A0ABP5F0K9_9ACTN